MTEQTVEIDRDALAFITERAQLEFEALFEDPGPETEEEFIEQYEHSLNVAYDVLDEERPK